MSNIPDTTGIIGIHAKNNNIIIPIIIDIGFGISSINSINGLILVVMVTIVVITTPFCIFYTVGCEYSNYVHHTESPLVGLILQ